MADRSREKHRPDKGEELGGIIGCLALAIAIALFVWIAVGAGCHSAMPGAD